MTHLNAGIREVQQPTNWRLRDEARAPATADAPDPAALLASPLEPLPIGCSNSLMFMFKVLDNEWAKSSTNSLAVSLTSFDLGLAGIRGVLARRESRQLLDF